MPHPAAMVGAALLAFAMPACKPAAKTTAEPATASSANAAAVATPAHTTALQVVPPQGLPTRTPTPNSARPIEEEVVVELTGGVRLAPGAPRPGMLTLLVTEGDCLGASPRLLRRMTVGESGTFLAMVLAGKGSELSICVAEEATPGTPSSLFGRSLTPMKLGQASEQVFRDISVELAQHAPHSFPTTFPP